MPNQDVVYRRIVLKISGEALIGEKTHGIDPKVLDRLSKELVEAKELGVEVSVVIGGGNLFRGAQLSEAGIDRVTGDNMGMLATVINALALRESIVRAGSHVVVMSAIPMTGVVDHFDRRHAIEHLQAGCIVIFAGGTGNPYVTTDSAASLRGIEIGADILLKATQVDGVYSDDPRKNPDATLYKHLSYNEVLDKELGVMDLSAFCQCRDNQLPMRIFNIEKRGAIKAILQGKPEGTLVDRGGAQHD